MNAADRLPSELATALLGAGISISQLEERCTELILCGSRAQHVNTVDSDWDLVAIGDDIRRRKRGSIDLIPVDFTTLASPRWLESELAWHVKTYGVWLIGQPGEWVGKIRITERTLGMKVGRIRYRLSRIDQAWPHLSVEARTRQLKLLRRDLQRHARLTAMENIPASPYLDDIWEAVADRSACLDVLLAGLPADVREKCRKCLPSTEVD